MAISLENVAKIYAQGRNYINMGIGVLVGVGAMSAGQQKGVMEALTEIGNGFTQIVHGSTSLWTILAVVFGPLVTAYLAKKAGNAASTQGQKDSLVARAQEDGSSGTAAKVAVLDAATKLPDVEIKGAIAAPPEVAGQVPSSQVVAKL